MSEYFEDFLHSSDLTISYLIFAVVDGSEPLFVTPFAVLKKKMWVHAKNMESGLRSEILV